MKPLSLQRGELPEPGAVLAENVLDTEGRVALDKGRALTADDVRRIAELPWKELHVVALQPGDVHEEEAGRRLATLLAGEGIAVEALSSGAHPLVARQRGLLELDTFRLARLNEIEDLAVYVRPSGYVAREGERIGGVKIIPFVTREERLVAAERVAGGGMLRVRRFVAMRVAVLVEETVEERVLSRARRALEEKLGFFGSEPPLVQRVRFVTDALGDALRAAVDGQAQLILLAGGNPMDPLDPALLALERIGARMEKQGIPAQPGTLLWLAYAGAIPIVGAPSCGLFAKASALDLLLPPLLTGERLSRAAIAELGAGGLITAEVAWRLAPYRGGVARGQLDPE
jgi:molybdopterin biosynthesis enzyme